MADADRALAEVVAAVRRALASEIASTSMRFLVGYSGGVDSTVLLGSLTRIVGPERIRALHVDHALQPESPQWARHCVTVGEALGVPVATVRVDVPLRGSREANARAARYRAFESSIGRNDVLLLAHNANDQAETVLLKLLQGRRAGGMPERRPIGLGLLVRPLLRLPRETIAAAARALAVAWVEDASNRDVALDRNFLRHAAIPALARRWPHAVARLAEQADALAADAALANRALDAELAAVSSDALPIAWLMARDHRARLVRRWLERRGVRGTSERVLGELERQLRHSNLARVVVHASPRQEVRAHAGALHLVEAEPRAFEPRVWCLEAPLNVGRARLSARWLGRSAAAAIAVAVRPRTGGERLRVAGSAGARSVKRLLHEAGLPPWHRAGYPLLYLDDRLAVVPGIAVAADVADRFATGPGAHADARWVVSIDLA